ncbi:ribonuclease P protein subunit [Candidatus Woesearchaeota archaeon]|nr:ribonuclease P protein subunit [Candidatus Woesearchaeota archaeon]
MAREDIEILRGEFIGKQIIIPSMKIEGKIIDETKNSFLVMTKNARKRVLKGNSLFQVKTANGFVEVDGKAISMKPEDRIKIKSE